MKLGPCSLLFYLSTSLFTGPYFRLNWNACQHSSRTTSKEFWLVLKWTIVNGEPCLITYILFTFYASVHWKCYDVSGNIFWIKTWCMHVLFFSRSFSISRSFSLEAFLGLKSRRGRLKKLGVSGTCSVWDATDNTAHHCLSMFPPSILRRSMLRNYPHLQ